MPKFNGKTDSPLQIKLKSAILEARWGEFEVAQGGRVQIEVVTAFVSDGSTVKFSLKDKEGAAIDTVTGKIYANLYRGYYTVTKPNKTGAMTFEAELPDHNAKGKSGFIKVSPPVKITELKILDGSGKELKEIAKEAILQMSAKVGGPPEGTVCDFVMYCTNGPMQPQPTFTGRAKIADGKAVCQWKRKAPQQEPHVHVQSDLNKYGEDYHTLTYHFEISCLGMTAASKPVDYVSWLEMHFGDLRGKVTLVLPDGSESSKDIPEDGVLKLEKPKAGGVMIKKIEPKDGTAGEKKGSGGKPSDENTNKNPKID